MSLARCHKVPIFILNEALKKFKKLKNYLNDFKTDESFESILKRQRKLQKKWMLNQDFITMEEYEERKNIKNNSKIIILFRKLRSFYGEAPN